MGKVKKILIPIIAAIVFFVLGLVADSLYGPFIKINHLTEIQTWELVLDDTPENEFIEKLSSVLDMALYKAQDYQYIVRNLENEIMEMELSKGIDNIAEEASTNVLKGLGQDIKDNRLRIVEDYFWGYAVAVDFEYFLVRYEERLPDYAKRYLEFRDMELDNNIFNSNYECFDIDEAVRRIDFIINELQTETEYTSAYMSLYEMYLSILRGEQTDYHLDLETGFLTSYAKTCYSKYLEREDTVGDIAREMVEIYGGEANE